MPSKTTKTILKPIPEIPCWDNIEWLRAYVEYVQDVDSEMDEDATKAADKKIKKA
jgi:hypothetical protein